MEKTFSVNDYLQHLAHELTRNFDYAGKATTPGLVGGARETEVRTKLSLLFPSVVGVGTGCVIDSYGLTSKQTDVVLFEKNICPVFSINNAPESTYYPCESVIAVGEIKSTLDTRDLTDSFAKIKSIKSLKRFTTNTTTYRSYGSINGILGADEERYDPDTKFSDQIFGFILCERIGLKLDSFLSLLAQLSSKEQAQYLPNVIISLNDGVFIYNSHSTNDNILKQSAHGANSIFYSKLSGGEFQYLLSHLNWIFSQGRSTRELPFARYINAPTQFPEGMIKPFSPMS